MSDEPLPGDEVTVVEDIEEPAEEADKAEVLTLIRQAFDRVEKDYGGNIYNRCIIMIISDPQDGHEPAFQVTLTDKTRDIEAFGYLELAKQALLGVLPEIDMYEDDHAPPTPPTEPTA